MKKIYLLEAILLMLGSFIPAYAMENEQQYCSSQSKNIIESIIMQGTIAEFNEQKGHLDNLSYENIEDLILAVHAKKEILDLLQPIGFGTKAWGMLIPIKKEIEIETEKRYHAVKMQPQTKMPVKRKLEFIAMGTLDIIKYTDEYIAQEKQKISPQEQNPDLLARAQVLHFFDSISIFCNSCFDLESTVANLDEFVSKKVDFYLKADIKTNSEINVKSMSKEELYANLGNNCMLIEQQKLHEIEKILDTKFDIFEKNNLMNIE
jgi:hypothetical protein